MLNAERINNGHYADDATIFAENKKNVHFLVDVTLTCLLCKVMIIGK